MVLTSVVPAREDAHPVFPALAKPFLLIPPFVARLASRPHLQPAVALGTSEPASRVPLLSKPARQREVLYNSCDHEMKGNIPDPSLRGPLWQQWRELEL